MGSNPLDSFIVTDLGVGVKHHLQRFFDLLPPRNATLYSKLHHAVSLNLFNGVEVDALEGAMPKSVHGSQGDTNMIMLLRPDVNRSNVRVTNVLTTIRFVTTGVFLKFGGNESVGVHPRFDRLHPFPGIEMLLLIP